MPYRKVGYAEQIWYMLRWKLKEVFRMPTFPDHPCRHPGCPKLVPKGKKYCDEHVSLHPEEVRSAAARGYNARWRRLSKLFLLSHPLCVECQREGKYVKATVVDHIRPHRDIALIMTEPEQIKLIMHVPLRDLHGIIRALGQRFTRVVLHGKARRADAAVIRYGRV